jgi:hypothetical protein
VIRALGSAGCFSRCLNGRQQQSDENTDDGNHDEQFNKRETLLRPHETSYISFPDQAFTVEKYSMRRPSRLVAWNKIPPEFAPLKN